MHQASTPLPAAPAAVAPARLPDAPPADAGAAPIVAPEELSLLKRQVLDPDPEFQHFEQSSSLNKRSGLLDYLIATNGQRHDPDPAFARLRWGGQFVYVSRNRREVEDVPERFAERGFAVGGAPGFVRGGWGIPLISRKYYYIAARKTALVPPREFSDRFTYQVALERQDVESNGPPSTGHWVVRKEVPSFERILARLKFKAPDLPHATLERRAKKFAEQIFPLFLTREAAMLKIIDRECPKEYRQRFPRLVHMEKDGKGYVQRLWTTWLRNGGRPLSHIEFARQGAELLHVLHERIGIIHLDLRMDNMVISQGQVGFVDFGSAVRDNENIHGNAVLSTLFGELMRTSQIQRMMDRMATAGALTSTIIREAYQRVDKAVDLFYLALQIGQPNANPELRELIRYDKFTPEGMELARLSNAVLKPANPGNPKYRTARDVLAEILRIEADLKSGRYAQAQPAEPVESSKAKVWIWR